MQAEITPFEPEQVMLLRERRMIHMIAPIISLLFYISKNNENEKNLFSATLFIFISHILCAETFDPNSTIALDEVVITATKVGDTTPVAHSKVTREELKTQNFGQDIPYLMARTPSVIVTSDAGTGIGYTAFRVRGTDANRINITVNGVPVNDSESHTVFWVNMPDFASSVQQVQIQRGVGTSTHGAAAFGATVSMQTLGATPLPYAEYAVSTGSFGTLKNTVMAGTGLMDNRWSFDARYSKLNSDGFVDRASANMGSYYATAAYYGATTLVKLLAFGSDEVTYQAWGGIPKSMLKDHRTYNPCGLYKEDGVDKFYENQTDNYKQNNWQLFVSQLINNRWNANATFHYTHGTGYYEEYKGDAKLKTYALSHPSILTTDLVRQKWLANDFGGVVFSLNYKTERVSATLGGAANLYKGNHFGNVIWAKEAISLPLGHEYYRSYGKKTDYNLFAKAQVAFTKSLHGYMDLQYRGIHYSLWGVDDNAGEIDIRKRYPFFNPKAGLFYNINKQHVVYASAAVANREPNRKNFTEAGINEQPLHETLYDYEAGYRFSSPSFTAEANFYFMDYTNQLVLTGKISDIGEPLTSNIADSYRMGIELSLGAKITNWLSWSGNMTLSRNRINNYTEYVDDYETGLQREEFLGNTDIAFSPNIMGNSIFEGKWGNLRATFTSTYVGKQYIDNTSNNNRSLDAYFVNNIQVGYVFKFKGLKELSLDAIVNNIFNEQYETNAWVYSYYETNIRKQQEGYFAQAGTSFMARLTFKF